MRIVAAVWCLVISTINSGCYSNQKFYYTKPGSGGYSREGRGLIPFPRTGRSTNTWLVPVSEDREELEATAPSAILSTTTLQQESPPPPQHKQQQLQHDEEQDGEKSIHKRSIPESNAFHRRLLRAQPESSYYRRLTRSGNDNAYHRRLLRSDDNAYARRLIRSQDVFNRRLIRSDNSAFYRRLLRSPSEAYKRRIFKKASLIPFPRTGKRSQDMSGEDEESVPVMQTMSSYLPLSPADLETADPDQVDLDMSPATLEDLQDLEQDY